MEDKASLTSSSAMSPREIAIKAELVPNSRSPSYDRFWRADIDTRGYQVDELRLTIDSHRLIRLEGDHVKGHHHEHSKDPLFHEFMLPANVEFQTLKSIFTTDGHLLILAEKTGHAKNVKLPKKRSPSPGKKKRGKKSSKSRSRSPRSKSAKGHRSHRSKSPGKKQKKEKDADHN